MNSNVVNLGLIEKEFPYRYKWSSTIGVIISGGLGMFGMAWLAISGSWFWWLGSLFMSVVFLGGFYIAVINLFGNRRLILTRESIYLPSVWKSERYSVIRYSEIKKIGLVDVQGNMIMRLSTAEKEYDIVHTWLSSEDVFKGLLKLVHERVNLPLDMIPPPS